MLQAESNVRARIAPCKQNRHHSSRRDTCVLPQSAVCLADGTPHAAHRSRHVLDFCDLRTLRAARPAAQTQALAHLFGLDAVARVFGGCDRVILLRFRECFRRLAADHPHGPRQVRQLRRMQHMSANPFLYSHTYTHIHRHTHKRTCISTHMCGGGPGGAWEFICILMIL